MGRITEQRAKIGCRMRMSEPKYSLIALTDTFWQWIHTRILTAHTAKQLELTGGATPCIANAVIRKPMAADRWWQSTNIGINDGWIAINPALR